MLCIYGSKNPPVPSELKPPLLLHSTKIPYGLVTINCICHRPKLVNCIWKKIYQPLPIQGYMKELGWLQISCSSYSSYISRPKSYWNHRNVFITYCMNQKTATPTLKTWFLHHKWLELAVSKQPAKNLMTIHLIISKCRSTQFNMFRSQPNIF